MLVKWGLELEWRDFLDSQLKEQVFGVNLFLVYYFFVSSTSSISQPQINLHSFIY